VLKDKDIDLGEKVAQGTELVQVLKSDQIIKNYEDIRCGHIAPSFLFALHNRYTKAK
jgi:hypothetical protein